MKRIDIEDTFCGSIIDELNIRPSVKNRIRKGLYHKNVWDIRDLCKHNEEYLSDIPGIDSDIIDKIRDKLENAGLHFNMTDKELDDYMDADFLEGLTGDEPVIDVSRVEYSMTPANDAVDTQAKTPTPETDSKGKESSFFDVFLLISGFIIVFFLGWTIHRLYSHDRTRPLVENTSTYNDNTDYRIPSPPYRDEDSCLDELETEHEVETDSLSMVK